MPLENAPGSHFAYSNFGYCLLGRVIEAVSNVSYEKFVQQNILKKIGAKGSCTVGSGARYYTAKHGGEGDWTLRPAMDSKADFDLVARMDAHGGWLLSASDLVKFSQAIEDGTLLNKASRAALVTPAKGGYAMGCIVSGHARFHGGSLVGEASILVRTSQHGGMSWALIMNSHNEADFPFQKLDPFARECVGDVLAMMRS